MNSKKFLCSLLISFFIIGVFSFSSFAYTQNVIYSDLPEPVPTDRYSAFVLAPANSSDPPFLYVFFYNPANSESEINIQWVMADDGYWYYQIGGLGNNNNSANTNVYMAQYQAVTGRFITSKEFTQPELIKTSFNKTNYPFYSNYGCSLQFETPSTSVDGLPAQAQIYWSYKSTNDWFNDLINISLNATNNYLNQIKQYDMQIYNELQTFYTLYSDYYMWLRNTYFQEFMNQSDLLNMQYNMLSYMYTQLQIISDLLGWGEENTEIEEPNTEAFSDYEAAENALMTDYGGDLENALSAGSQISNFGSAFQWLSVTMQQLILNNGKLNLLIMFSLGLGMAVMVVGRKINR